MATSKVYPPAATAGNLIAVTGGSAYSIFKSFEMASNIDERRQYCSEVLANMRNWTGTDNTEELLRRLEITEEEVEKLLACINGVNGNMKQSYMYATINAAVQVTLGVISIGINAAASRRNNDNIWDPINVMNMFVVPALISSQYIIHSMFIARPLRKMSNQSVELKSGLEKLKNSAQVQMWKLNKLANEIDNYYQQLSGLDAKIEHDNVRLIANRQRTEQINSQPILIEEEERIQKELTILLEERKILEQEIISSMESRSLLVDTLRTLVHDTNKLITELGINFDQHKHFNSIVQHFQVIRSQLDHEVSGSPSSLPLKV